MTDLRDQSADASVRGVEQLDTFVFRRIAEGQYAHIGGQGRGEGWAGIVSIDLGEERSIADAVITQQVVEHRSIEPTRLFGPYWASEAVVVPVGRDELVVLGGAGALSFAPDELDAVVRNTSDRVGGVSPAKRLADELEMLHAVKDVALTPLTRLDVVADRVLAQAAAALSCEIAVLHLPASGVVVVHDASAPTPVSTEDAAVWAARMSSVVEGDQRCFQELRAEDRVGLPASADQVLSMLSISLDIEPGAVLLLAHTTRGPRGFTDLCRDIATNVADAARTVLLASMQHDQLLRRAQEADTRASTDALTGLLNRRGWEGALDAVDPAAEVVSVMLADGNHLKRINDAEGHTVGDTHIVAWSQALRQHVRTEDPLARVGGDEFGVLLVGADEQRCAELAARVCATLEEAPLSTSLAIGHATGRGVELAELVSRADRAMYLDKGDRCR